MGDTVEHILASVKVTEVIVEWVGQPPLQVTQSYSLTEKHSDRILYNRFTNSKHPKQPIRKIQNFAHIQDQQNRHPNPFNVNYWTEVCNAETLYSMCCSGRNYENELRAFVGGKLPLLFSIIHTPIHSTVASWIPRMHYVFEATIYGDTLSPVGLFPRTS